LKKWLFFMRRSKIHNNKNLTISKFKLSFLIFFLFFSFGSITPILSLYLTQILHFSPTQVGLILSLAAVSSLVTPIIGAVFADRLISTEKLFSILILISGLSLIVMPLVQSFYSFLILYGLYAMVLGPSISLMNTIIFHHVKGGSKNYGFIRVWGTLGWIAVAWGFGYFWLKIGDTNSKLFTAFYLSGFINIFLGVLVFFIPSAVINLEKKIELFPKSALKIILNRDILIMSSIIFLSFFTDAFYVFGAAPFLKSTGLSGHYILPVLSIGQILEIPAMFLLAKFLSKFGIRKIIIWGVFFNFLRYFFISQSTSILGISFGILFHGPAYAFIFSSAFIFLDKNSDKKNRAGVQQYYAIITSGMGSFFGNNLAGYVAKLNTINGNINYSSYWSIPLMITISLLLFIVFVFKPKSI